ncbi:MAG: hypothetical protein WCD33_10475, partial [Mycobacterium sp.]
MADTGSRDVATNPSQSFPLAAGGEALYTERAPDAKYTMSLFYTSITGHSDDLNHPADCVVYHIMTGRGLRWLGVTLLCSACAGLLGVTSLMTAASAFGDDVALITAAGGDDNVGGVPAVAVVTDLYNLYVDPAQPPLPFSGQPVFPGFTEISLNTPDANSIFGLGG